MREMIVDREVIRWGIKALAGVIAVGTFGLLGILVLCWQPKRLLLTAYGELQQFFREKRRGLLDYQKLEEYLKRNGADFHFGKWINPVSFTAVRLLLGGTGIFLGAIVGYVQGFALAFLLFWLPDGMLLWMNSRDNERMLPEIKLVYHAISMQIRAGVYVTDALAECYGSVKDVRLRTALLSLSGEIALKADVEDALERFQTRFDNRYVDSLCITMLQAMESGQAVDLLSDIAEQIKDMETALMNKKKNGLDRNITFYQLGILSAVLIVVLYACVTQMFAAAMSF